jgi:hypothetical protein
MVVSVDTSERVAFLEGAHGLFNDRRIEALIKMMIEDVDWPDVASAEVLHGRVAVIATGSVSSLLWILESCRSTSFGLGMISWPLSSNASSISKVSP